MCTTGPCDGLCANPTTFTQTNFQSGNLGVEARCFQTVANIQGGNCSNFGTRTIRVNSMIESCTNGNWPPLPLKLVGGYCFVISAGDPNFASFVTF
jgi:hypothetical protein